MAHVPLEYEAVVSPPAGIGLGLLWLGRASNRALHIIRASDPSQSYMSYSEMKFFSLYGLELFLHVASRKRGQMCSPHLGNPAT
jgi:hypothetical protein